MHPRARRRMARRARAQGARQAPVEVVDRIVDCERLQAKAVRLAGYPLYQPSPELAVRAGRGGRGRPLCRRNERGFCIACVPEPAVVPRNPHPFSRGQACLVLIPVLPGPFCPPSPLLSTSSVLTRPPSLSNHGQTSARQNRQISWVARTHFLLRRKKRLFSKRCQGVEGRAQGRLRGRCSGCQANRTMACKVLRRRPRTPACLRTRLP